MSWIFNAYSEVYQAAMLQKPEAVAHVATAKQGSVKQPARLRDLLSRVRF